MSGAGAELKRCVMGCRLCKDASQLCSLLTLQPGFGAESVVKLQTLSWFRHFPACSLAGGRQTRERIRTSINHGEFFFTQALNEGVVCWSRAF